jgi:hypothetical protein
MGNFLIVLGFLMICSAPFSVYASELLGRISTDPAANTGAVISVPEAPSPVVTATGNGGPSVPVIPSRAADTLTDKEPAPTEKTVKILGQKIYPDACLVRDEEGRIFFIQGKVKLPIRNMLELEKYRGQAILRGTADDLSQYRTREHLDGDLIRQKNDVKVYALKKGIKYHVLNLVELAKHYFGLPIYNLEPEEMKKYD